MTFGMRIRLEIRPAAGDIVQLLDKHLVSTVSLHCKNKQVTMPHHDGQLILAGYA